MDRDRDRRRDPDIPPEDQFKGGRGQSYRPGNARERTPTRMDSYRARSPPRRSDYALNSYKADSYRGPRPRSRSPLRRDNFRRRSPSPARYRDRDSQRGGDSYRSRPRSPLPPRREELPRDDLFRRDPLRDERDYRESRDFRDDRDRDHIAAIGRSPLPRYRERSPVPIRRGREPSPVSSRGRRTPQPPKRERLASPPRTVLHEEFPASRGVSPPRRRYSPDFRDRHPSPIPRAATRDHRLHSRSPPARNTRIDPRALDDWRKPRSPMRDSRQEHITRDGSAINSATPLRHSSPPVHPSRMALQPPPSDEKARPDHLSPRRDPVETRESYRAPDTEPRKVLGATRDVGNEEERSHGNDRDSKLPPREPPREDDASILRAPPTGPSSQRATSTPMPPPAAPAAVSTPLGPRAIAAPPAGPRGAPASRGDIVTRGRGGFAADYSSNRGRGSFSATFRGGRGGSAPTAPGQGRGETFNQDPGPAASRPPPSGPRNSVSQPTPITFRQGGSLSASAPPTQPRAQRFANDMSVPDAPTGPKGARRATETMPTTANRPHPALADLPKVIEGGQKAEPLVDRTKLNRLEEESEKLRKQIEERETKKRKSLREWDRMTRETEAAALRSELAEQALKQLNGETGGQAAF